ncbi:MAG TPA: LysR family transcriptional regulator [Rhodocyclaceae bacterium]|nr:LysR family transcriptional regulator [Rhodocyclaceae bacterium]
MDRLEAMQLFARVAEAGSFSAVAQQLGVARSVVTRKIAALEAHLGAKLIVRSTRRLTLSSAGTAYLERCRVILNLVDVAEADVAHERAMPRGRIRASLPLSFGLRRLTPLLFEFSQRYPEVSLEMEYADRLVNLAEEGFDLSIRITGRLEPGDIVRKLGTCRLMIVASPDYLARHGRPRHPDELAQHECLGYSLQPSAQSWAFTVDGRVHHVGVRCRITANNGDALMAATLRGLGISIQPDFIASAHVAGGEAEAILTEYALPTLGIYAVLPSNRHVPYRVRALIDFLAQGGLDPRNPSGQDVVPVR